MVRDIRGYNYIQGVCSLCLISPYTPALNTTSTNDCAALTIDTCLGSIIYLTRKSILQKISDRPCCGAAQPAQTLARTCTSWQIMWLAPQETHYIVLVFLALSPGHSQRISCATLKGWKWPGDEAMCCSFIWKSSQEKKPTTDHKASVHNINSWIQLFCHHRATTHS